MRRNTIFEFWALVKIGKLNECWNWMACKDIKGYGIFRLETERKAHRIAYLTTTKIPLKNDVLHTCDNTSCCNPSHLYDGTTQQNTKDRGNRNRTHRKLSFTQITKIKQFHLSGFKIKTLCILFKVTRSTIYITLKR